jgi:hypothetical protein
MNGADWFGQQVGPPSLEFKKALGPKPTTPLDLLQGLVGLAVIAAFGFACYWGFRMLTLAMSTVERLEKLQ